MSNTFRGLLVAHVAQVQIDRLRDQSVQLSTEKASRIWPIELVRQQHQCTQSDRLDAVFVARGVLNSQLQTFNLQVKHVLAFRSIKAPGY